MASITVDLARRESQLYSPPSLVPVPSTSALLRHPSKHPGGGFMADSSEGNQPGWSGQQGNEAKRDAQDASLEASASPVMGSMAASIHHGGIPSAGSHHGGIPSAGITSSEDSQAASATVVINLTARQPGVS